MIRALWLAVLAPLLACQAKQGGASGAHRREFDGERAYADVQQQVAFGPRIPNTVGHERTGDWILERLRATADTVVVQGISHATRHGGALHLRNFLARFRPSAPARGPERQPRRPADARPGRE